MNKKSVYIIAIVALIIIGTVSWYLIAQKQETADVRQEIAVSSGGANFSPKQNIELQQGLVNLVGKYTEAVIMTNSVFFTDIEKTDYDDWEIRLDRAIELWEDLESLNVDMDQLFDEMGIPTTEDIALRQSLMEYTGTQKAFGLISVAHAALSGAPIPDAGAVTAVFDSAPHTQKLRRVMEVFGWSAKKATIALMQEKLLLESGQWDREGDIYQRWETAARIIKDASKVTIFIASNFITAGGASAAVGAFQGISMVVGGVSLAIEIGEDINIALGNEDNAAVLRQAQKDMGVLTFLVSIASLKDIGDPNNMFFIADQAGNLFNYAKDGYVYLTRTDDGKIYVSKQKPKDVPPPPPPPKPDNKPIDPVLPPGNYIIDGEQVEVKEEDTEVIDEVETLSEFEAPENPVIDLDSTKIRTGEVNNLSLEIPEGLTGPYDIESIEVGGSGAAVTLPSESSGGTIDGHFISSNPGTYVVEVTIRDADGNLYITKTTISVEGEPTRESEDDVDIEEYIAEQQMGLGGNVTVNDSIYYVPEDDLPHQRRGSGTMSLTILEDMVSGTCNITAKDYYKCPAFHEGEVVETCISGTGESYPGGSWVPNWAVDFPGGAVEGTYYPSTGKIEAHVGEHYFTGTLVGNKASGRFYYELPNGEPAFFWSVSVQR